MITDDVRQAYGSRRGLFTRKPPTVGEIGAEYRQRGEKRMLEAALAAGAVYGLCLADRVDLSLVDDQMREAFELAYPSVPIDSLSTMSADQIAGIANGWRGKYFEVLVRDRLNAGESVGDLFLLDGQTAQLAENATQPGWDLQLVDESGFVVEEFQLKASASLSYVQHAFERYPEIEIIATDEVAELSARIARSGYTDAELTERILGPIESLFDSPLGDLVETVLPALPFALIALGAGNRVMVGRQAFRSVIPHAFFRTAKTSASIGVGALVALMDGGLLSVPATFLARIGFDRVAVTREMERQMEERIKMLMAIRKRLARTAVG